MENLQRMTGIFTQEYENGFYAGQQRAWRIVGNVLGFAACVFVVYHGAHFLGWVGA